MAIHWYVLSCKPRKERILWQQLLNLGIEVYYPRLVASKKHKSHMKYTPYFPGYLFVRMNLEEFGANILQRMPNTLGLVCFGDKPAYVPDHLLQAMKSRLAKTNDGEESSQLDSSALEQNVELGLLASEQETIFDDHLPGAKRVSELLRMLKDLSISTEG